MTSNDQHDRVIKVGDDWTVPASDGVGRRVIVSGAAWTIPVAAIAIAAPMAAASTTDPTLVFLNAPYAANACNAFGPVVLFLTSDGSTPDPGKTITVTLPDGLRWSDGSSSPRTFTTDQNGQVALTDLEAPASNGTYTIGGSSSTGASATAGTVSVTGATSSITTFTGAPLPTLPSGVTVVDLYLASPTPGTDTAVVLGSDGNVYRSSSSNRTTWTDWRVSPSPLAGTVTAVAVNLTAGDALAVVTDGTSLTTFSGTALPALPSGVGVADVQMSRPAGTDLVTVLGTDGNAYRTSWDGSAYTPWQTSGAPFAGSISFVAIEQTSGYTGGLVSDGTRVSNFAGGALPSLPAGTVITQLALTSPPDDEFAEVLTSDGRAYRSRYTSGSGWSAWTESPSSLNGSVVAIVPSHAVGSSTVSVLTDGTRFSTFNGLLLPALPSGVSPVDYSLAKPSGNEFVDVLGNDGNAYRSTYDSSAGTWSSWALSPTPLATSITHIATNETSAGVTATILAGEACA